MSKIKNTMDGRKQASASAAIFNPRTIILMIFLGIFSFGAYFVLAGFSGDLKSGNNGGGHALSKSATGFGGLVYLLKQNQNVVDISRAPELSYPEQKKLRILTLTQQHFGTDLDELTLNSPTLIVLPKWNTRRYPGHKGWVRKANTPFEPMMKTKRISTLLTPVIENLKINRNHLGNMKFTIKPNTYLQNDDPISFFNFQNLQTIHGTNFIPIITTSEGVILAELKNHQEQIYILSDPDFLNTYGISKPDMAEFSLQVMEILKVNTTTNGFLFDLTLHGFGQSNNLIKLALKPPFLGATLCLLAMGFLIGWQAFVRFGDAVKPVREIALGKLSLIYNAAHFIKLAGREYKMAPGYANLTKKIAAEQLQIPSSLSDKEQSERLNAYSKHMKLSENWSELDALSRAPKNGTGLMKAAKDLYTWRMHLTKKKKK